MVDALTAVSEPYPWPWHGNFDPAHTALLVVHDHGAPPLHRDARALLCSIVELASRSGVTIGELPAPGPVAVTDYAADFRLERPHLGGFSGTDLDVLLRRRRITELIFAGFPFELGADCTMRQANDLGYECLALNDCCSGLSPETLAGAMATIQMSGGIFGAVAGTAAVFELLATSQSEAATAVREG